MPDEGALEAREPEGQPEEDSRPDWLPDNFKSPEDLANSYQELRRHTTQLAEERARQDDLIAEMAMQMQSEPEQQYIPQQGMDPLTAEMESALAEGDAQRVVALQAFMADRIVEQRLSQAQHQAASSSQSEAAGAMFARMVEDEAKRAYGDDDVWDSVKQDVGDLLQQRPNLLRPTTNPKDAAEDLLYVVNMVAANKGAVPQRDNPAARELEGALGSVGIPSNQQKRLAQTLAGAGVRAAAGSDESDAAYFERVKSASTRDWTGA